MIYTFGMIFDLQTLNFLRICLFFYLFGEFVANGHWKIKGKLMINKRHAVNLVRFHNAIDVYGVLLFITF